MLAKSFSMLCVFSALAIWFQAPSSQLPEESADALQPRLVLERVGQSIWSFDVRAEVTIKFWLNSVQLGKRGPGNSIPIVRYEKLKPGESPKETKTYLRQVYKRGKGRIEFLDGPDGKPLKYQVYNSDEEKTWEPERSTCSIQRTSVNLLQRGGDYRETFKTVEGSLDLAKFVGDRSMVTVQKTDRDLTIVIAAEPEPKPWKPTIDLPSWGVRAFLKPQYATMPRVIECYREFDGQMLVERRLTVVDWKKLASGVWVPLGASTQIYSPRKEVFGELANEITLKIDPSKSSWNNEIPDELFDLTLPPGTTVTDMIRQVEYVTGNPDNARN